MYDGQLIWVWWFCLFKYVESTKWALKILVELLEIEITNISLRGSLLVSCVCFVDTHIGGIGGEFSEIPDTEAGADNSTTSDYAADTLHIKLV